MQGFVGNSVELCNKRRRLAFLGVGLEFLVLEGCTD